MALVLNGRPFTRPITGVGRYGRSLLTLIAREWPDARVVVPRSTGDIDACGLEVVRRGIGNGHGWEQRALPSALGRDDVLLSTANTGPLRVRRQVLVLHDVEGFKHEEISAELGMAVGSSKAQLHRARGLLRRALADR